MAKRARPTKNEGLLSLIFKGIDRMMTDPVARVRTWKVFALLLILFCIFSLVSFVSYFFTGTSDQSVVEDGVASAADSQNWLGYFGAKMAELLVNKGFGVLSFILPLYGIVWGLAMLENQFYDWLRRIFKYTFFILIWGSAFLGFWTILYNSPNEPNLLWGGGVGNWLNLTFFSFVGKAGMGILLFFGLVIFLVYIGQAENAWRLVSGTVKGVSKTVIPPASKTVINAKNTIREKQGNLFSQALASVKSRLAPDKESTEKDTESKKQNPVNQPVKDKQTPPPPKEEKESPKEVVFHVRNKNTPPPVIPPKAEENGQLILEIAEGDPEIKIEEVPEIVSREKLGEDNVERVITASGEEFVEKILNEEDEEIENPEEMIEWELFDPTKELHDYQHPVFELLEDHGSGKGREVNRAELEDNKNKIVKALKDFGIEIQSIKATIGPTVTLYEIIPAAGVRISKIRNLEDDIALNLAALGIRIIAPMPGKGTIGIEIPNSNPEVVSLRSVLSTEKYLTSKAELPIVIGRTISNEVYIVDLNKLPHLLMAGSTGQGKSVGINTIITSLLYRKHPAEVKFVLIDPKKVELNLYQPLLHHFMAVMPEQVEPTITDSRDAVAVLNSLCVEMDNRYNMLKAAKVRNLKEYNEKFINRRLNPRKGHRFLPYIVLVIDELADLMMVSGKEVETPIARLAQLARAVGIHLVVATQRPSVNVITGIIKANFPARMSYRVISKVDSRTILDANGADQLIGRGDLLLSTGNDVIRIQNAFIDTVEVEKVVEFISKQRGYTEPYFLPEPVVDTKNDQEIIEVGDRDEMFEEAARVVVRYQLGSASLIQRKLKLGYARAGRIIDQLEKAGIVGNHSGSKAREVLVSDEMTLERLLANMD